MALRTNLTSPLKYSPIQLNTTRLTLVHINTTAYSPMNVGVASV